MKLRLGRVSGGSQKGVDGLIILDLINLAQNHAVDVLILFSGDEDLREAVLTAQLQGLTVCLVGYPQGQSQAQSPALIREADVHVLITREDVAPYLSFLRSPQSNGPDQAAQAVGPGESPAPASDGRTSPDLAEAPAPAPPGDVDPAMAELVAEILDDPRFVSGVINPEQPNRILPGIDRVLVAKIAEATGTFPVEPEVLNRARRLLRAAAVHRTGHAGDEPGTGVATAGQVPDATQPD